MAADKKRKLLGCAMMFGSIGALFLWGFYFNLFGHPIRLNGPFLGFFAWLAIGAFGTGYATSGVRAGLRAVGLFVLFMGGALALGIVLGHYR